MNILSRFWQWLGSQPEDRAAVIHRNRSEGAKKAWQTRKARRSMAVKAEPTLRDHEHPYTIAMRMVNGSVCVRCAFTDSADIANYETEAAFLASEHGNLPLQNNY